jgi:hypothetical protein
MVVSTTADKRRVSYRDLGHTLALYQLAYVTLLHIQPVAGNAADLRGIDLDTSDVMGLIDLQLSSMISNVKSACIMAAAIVLTSFSSQEGTQARTV